MKLCLMDKRDNSSTTHHRAEREDTWKSQLPLSEGTENTEYSDPINLSARYRLITHARSVHSVKDFNLHSWEKSFRWATLYLTEVTVHETLTNVFWAIDAQTVDTTVTVQVCLCYLVQRLRASWVSVKSRRVACKDLHSPQLSAKGYLHVSLTIGMVSAFPFNSFNSRLLVGRKMGFINTYGFKKKKERKSPRPSSPELFC